MTSADRNISSELRYDALVLRVGELFLKRGNRRRFEQRLFANVRDALRGLPVEVRQLRHRLMVRLDPDGGSELAEQALRRIELLPGYHSVSPVLRVEPEIEAMQAAALRLLRAQAPGHTFRVTAKRSDKRFALSSSELGRVVGTYLVEQTGIEADLHHPDQVIEIELVERHAFVFCRRQMGLGGLPSGSSGKGLLLLSGGIDSPVAGHLMINRGLHLDAVYFHSFPFISEQARHKVDDLATRLAHMQGAHHLLVVPFTEIQKAIKQACAAKLTVVLYRRFMMRIACELARARGLGALVTGESLAQVASQTIDNLRVIEDAATLPVLRPLIGTDKIDTIKRAERIGCYEISIRPFDDCCSLFVPRHPETRAQLGFTRSQEARLDVETLVASAVRDTEVWRVARDDLRRVELPSPELVTPTRSL